MSAVELAPGAQGNTPLPLRALDAVTQVMNICGTALIVGLMLLIGADVLSRNLLNEPVSGVPELVTLSIVAIVFLQSPQALRSGRFPRSDAFQPAIEQRFPRAARLLWDLFDLLGAGMTAVIGFATWPILVSAWQRQTFIGALGDFTAPVWPVRVTVILGCAVLTLQFLASILRRHGYGATP